MRVPSSGAAASIDEHAGLAAIVLDVPRGVRIVDERVQAAIVEQAGCGN